MEITHSPSASAEELLVAIARSEAYRQNLEALERRRLSAGSVAVAAEEPDEGV